MPIRPSFRKLPLHQIVLRYPIICFLSLHTADRKLLLRIVFLAFWISFVHFITFFPFLYAISIFFWRFSYRELFFTKRQYLCSISFCIRVANSFDVIPQSFLLVFLADNHRKLSFLSPSYEMRNLEYNTS